MRGADMPLESVLAQGMPLPPRARGRRRRTGSPISPTGLYPRECGADTNPSGASGIAQPLPPHARG